MLPKPERVNWLKSVEIFADTPDDVLDQIAAVLHERHVAAGETFIREGDSGDCMYLIKEGDVQIDVKNAPAIYLGAGEIVGEMSLLDPGPRSASVTALCDICLLGLDKTTFDALMAERAEIAMHVVHVLVRRLRQRNEMLQSEVYDLRVEIDRITQAQQVAEITDTAFFSDLQSRAIHMRRRRQDSEDDVPTA
ncbi:MAG: Crp/Fnr family transcriptional regulator [Caldilineaceae bacterium]|nr:Crp/Fnr family transcriptional regulator [Caldilineaceae bacterium]